LPDDARAPAEPLVGAGHGVIGALLARKKIIVCVGPGGVGKTTTSAALAALAAARASGARTLVSTIDPAPRLADALGVTLSAEPAAVPATVGAALGLGAHRLFVARLDTARAFAKLVEEQVTDAAMRRRIFDNPIYRQITTTLTGSQEYAATLALYDLVRGGQFDLIVLDTPPAAHALDFLEAPRRISDAISSPALGWFARPADASRFSWQRLRSGGALVLKRLGKLVGSRFLEDVAAFLTDFQVVLAGFLERAQSIEARLRQDDVSFLLVLSPETSAVDEALTFARQLQDAGIALGAFVVNRVHPPPRPSSAASTIASAGSGAPLTALPSDLELERRLLARAEMGGLPPDDVRYAARRLAEVVEEREQLVADEQRELARLAARRPDIPILRIPLLEHDIASLADIDSLAALRTISEHLGRA
jgi:anion-transporting  ArsA/GET3 family ATPase